MPCIDYDQGVLFLGFVIIAVLTIACPIAVGFGRAWQKTEDARRLAFLEAELIRRGIVERFDTEQDISDRGEA